MASAFFRLATLASLFVMPEAVEMKHQVEDSTAKHRGAEAEVEVQADGSAKALMRREREKLASSEEGDPVQTTTIFEEGVGTDTTSGESSGDEEDSGDGGELLRTDSRGEKKTEKAQKAKKTDPSEEEEGDGESDDGDSDESDDEITTTEGDDQSDDGSGLPSNGDDLTAQNSQNSKASVDKPDEAQERATQKEARNRKEPEAKADEADSGDKAAEEGAEEKNGKDATSAREEKDEKDASDAKDEDSEESTQDQSDEDDSDPGDRADAGSGISSVEMEGFGAGPKHKATATAKKQRAKGQMPKAHSSDDVKIDSRSQPATPEKALRSSASAKGGEPAPAEKSHSKAQTRKAASKSHKERRKTDLPASLLAPAAGEEAGTTLTTTFYFTLVASNKYCANANSGYKKNVGNYETKACFDYVMSDDSCGKYFDFGVVDGACDCVPKAETSCNQADAENYHVYMIQKGGPEALMEFDEEGQGSKEVIGDPAEHEDELQD